MAVIVVSDIVEGFAFLSLYNNRPTLANTPTITDRSPMQITKTTPSTKRIPFPPNQLKVQSPLPDIIKLAMSLSSVRTTRKNLKKKKKISSEISNKVSERNEMKTRKEFCVCNC